MKIESIISNSVIEAVKALYGQEVAPKMVQIQKTKQEFEGNLTLVVPRAGLEPAQPLLAKGF